MSIKDLVSYIKRNGLLSSMPKLEELYRLAIEGEEKISALEARCAVLAAENAGLKAALRPSDIPSEWTDTFGDTAVIEHDATGDNQGHSVSWSWVGNQEEVIKSVLLAVDKGIETPATDAFLAEVRAQGVEMMAEMYACEAIKDGDVEGWKSNVSNAASEYAAQLRKEAAQ
ncbi:hypothetical protein ORA46_000207 [Enterobacter asburiae]|nr:hypothetical protein [Enterobacter asburiae]